MASEAPCGTGKEAGLSVMGTRLDARNGVESGAILPDRLGALGPAAGEPESLWLSCHIGPSVRFVTRIGAA